MFKTIVQYDEYPGHVGNREDLLAGAKRCLLEKGYRATTARDIAAASGASLAAIGYHFGSKEALMNRAVYEAVGEWGETFEQAMAQWLIDPKTAPTGQELTEALRAVASSIQAADRAA